MEDVVCVYVLVVVVSLIVEDVQDTVHVEVVYVDVLVVTVSSNGPSTVSPKTGWPSEAS